MANTIRQCCCDTCKHRCDTFANNVRAHRHRCAITTICANSSDRRDPVVLIRSQINDCVINALWWKTKIISIVRGNTIYGSAEIRSREHPKVHEGRLSEGYRFARLIVTCSRMPSFRLLLGRIYSLLLWTKTMNKFSCRFSFVHSDFRFT